MPLQVDRTGLPLLRLNYIGDYTDDELLRFLAELKAVLAQPGSKAALIDLCEATAGTARQRTLQGEWIREHESLLARDFVAAAIVTDSALIRGTVTAVFWIRPLPMPTHVAPTLAAAEAWLTPYLAKIKA